MDYFSDCSDYEVVTQHIGVVPHATFQVFEGPCGGVIASVDELLNPGLILKSSGSVNFQQKLKALNRHIDICKLQQLAIDYNYHDKQIVDLNGFPLDMQMQYFTPTSDVKNHPSVLAFIDHVCEYIDEEIKQGLY
jgi:hypothetical protein